MTLPGLEFFFSTTGFKEPTKKAKEKDENESENENENDDVGEESGVQESSQISQMQVKEASQWPPRRKGFPRSRFGWDSQVLQELLFHCYQ